MRRVLTTASFVAALLAAAFFAVAAFGDSTSAQESVTVDMGPAEGPDGGGDQSGTVTLTPMDGQTEVVVDIDPSPDGADVEQPAHIHAGTCDNLGAVEYPLNNVVNGQSTTVVDVALEDLQTGDFSINIHKNADEIGVYVSCGDIPAAAQETATPEPSPTASPGSAPGTGGPPGGGGAPIAAYLLIALGAAMVAASGILVARVRRI